MGFEPTTFCMATTPADRGFRYRNCRLQGLFDFPGRCALRRYDRICTEMQRFGNSCGICGDTLAFRALLAGGARNERAQLQILADRRRLNDARCEDGRVAER